MKYKNIKSMAHNFVASFLDWNQEDSVVELLKQLACEAKGEKIRIDWVPFQKESLHQFDNKIQEAICKHREWLPEQAQKQGVELKCLKSFYLEMVLKENHHIGTTVQLVDDRNKEYRIELIV